MSLASYRAVWKHSESKGSARLVLLCLAEHADDDGYCWPSIRRISEMTNVSKRQVSRALKQLDEDGEIKYTPGDGRGNHSHYVILLPSAKDDTVSPNSAEKDDTMSKKDDMVSERVTSHPQKDDTMSSEPLVNRKESVNNHGRTYSGISEHVDVGSPNGHEDPDRVAMETEMLSAISQVVKEVFVEHENAGRFYAVRDAFIEAGITPKQVRDFEDYWRKADVYSGPPALTSLQNHIKASLSDGTSYDDTDDFQVYYPEEA